MKIFYLFFLLTVTEQILFTLKNSNKMLIDVNTLVKKPISLKRTYIKTFHKKINKKIGCLSNQVKTVVFNSFCSFSYVSLEKSYHFKFGLTPNSCESFPSGTTRSLLLPRNKEIDQKSDLKFHKTREEDKRIKPCQNP